MQNILLTGDIGATKTTLAVITNDQEAIKFQFKKTFITQDYDSLESILSDFLKLVDYEITYVCLGVAGPVSKGIAVLPNLSWEIDELELSDSLNIPVKLLNDLEAIAYEVPNLDKENMITLRSGTKERDGTIAVIAPGTGLGEAFICWDGQKYQPYPSEGGHSDFAPANYTQIELLDYLQKKYGHVSIERVCSGPGIFNIYSFLKDSEKFQEPDWLQQKIADAKDPTLVISEAAQEKKAEIAIETLNLFASILGGEAGNLALKFLSTGGLFIGGGILPRILPFFNKEAFIKSFDQKGRLSEMISQIPIFLINNTEAPLIGAGICGLSLINID